MKLKQLTKGMLDIFIGLKEMRYLSAERAKSLKERNPKCNSMHEILRLLIVSWIVVGLSSGVA